MTNFTSTVAMAVYLATGNGDITASSGSFPAFATTTLQNSSGVTINNTFVLAGYFELTATPTATFLQTPAFTFTSSSISGSTTTCYVFSLNNSNNGGYTPYWQQQFASSSKTATSATFTPQTVTQVQIGNPAGINTPNGSGPSYLAVACH